MLALRPFRDVGEYFLAGDDGALAALARRDGYLHLPGLLPVEPVRAAGDRLAASCARNGLSVMPGAAPPPISWSDARAVAVQAELLAAPELRAVADHAALRPLLAVLLGGRPERAGGDVCRIAFPEALDRYADLATPPHQDAFYMKPSGPVWIAWIPLGDCPIARGPLAVIAGSHTGGLRPHAGDSLDTLRAQVGEQERWTCGDLRTGDVLLLDALTVHRALPNRTSALRLSADFRFRAGRTHA